MNASHAGRRSWLMWLASYLVLAIGLSWPVAFSGRQVVPGGARTDVWNALWVLQWQSDSLWSGRLPFSVEVLNYPEGGSLLPADLLSAGWSLLVVPLLGPALTLRLMVLTRLAATGLCAHAFAATWLQERGLPTRTAWLTGLGLMASPTLLVSIHNGVPEGLHGAWMVLAVWAFWRSCQAPTWPRLWLVAVSWSLLAVASWYLLIPGVVLAVAIAGSTRPALRSFCGSFVVGLVPVSALAGLTALTLHEASAPLGKSIRPTASWASAFSPSASSVALDELFLPFRTAPLSPDGFHVAVYLGVVASVLGSVGIWRVLRARGLWFYGACAVLSTLALGTSLSIATGAEAITPLPLSFLRLIPGVEAFEFTWRVLPGVTFASCLGLAALGARWHPLVVAGVAVALVLDLRLCGLSEGALEPTDASVPAAITAIADQPMGAVITVPRDGDGRPDGYYQSHHKHPTTWAFDATTNKAHHAFLDEVSAAWRADEPLPEAAERAGRGLGIRYLVVLPGPEFRRSPYGRVVRNLERSLTPLAGSPPTEMRSYRLW